jgi:hypothetical protein
MGMESDANDLIRLVVISVIAQLMPDKKQDQQTGRDADRQSGDINGRKSSVSTEITEGDHQEVFDHVTAILKRLPGAAGVKYRIRCQNVSG